MSTRRDGSIVEWIAGFFADRSLVTLLHRCNDGYRARADGVIFQMTDGHSRIVYRISRMALDDRAMFDGILSDRLDTFLRYRTEIEQIASAKHDAGDTEPVVSTIDFNIVSRALPHPPLRSSAEQPDHGSSHIHATAASGRGLT